MRNRESVQRFKIIVEPDEEGFHVYVPALNGCHSWGATRAEARTMIRPAIRLWLETAEEQGIAVDRGK